MIPNTVGRWLLVTLALLGLALAVPVVSAHGGEPLAANETVDAEPPVVDRTERIGWMDTHMGTDVFDARGWHMGFPVDDMTTQMGLTVQEMTPFMGTDNHRDITDDGREITDDHRDIADDRRDIADDRRGIADNHYDGRTRGHGVGC